MLNNFLYLATVAIALNDTIGAKDFLKLALKHSPSPSQWGYIMKAIQALS